MVFAALAAVAVAAPPYSAGIAGDWTPSRPQLLRVEAGEVVVESEMTRGRNGAGSIRAAVLVHAARANVFRLMIDCKHALKFVPHLERCAVLQGAPDAAWQVIEQVLNLSWYLPRTRYVFRVDYVGTERVCFRAIGGDLRVNDGCWVLRSRPDDATASGGNTLLTYRARIEPRFYVPQWLVRDQLRRQLPEMLRSLRQYCEAPAH